MDMEKIILGSIAVILVGIILVLLTLNISAAAKKSGFTQLYLIGDNPKTISPNQNYRFSFGIHNMENKRVTYNYAVYLQSEKIDQGQVTLNHNQTTVITKSFAVTNQALAFNSLDNISIPVSVQLINKGQEVHFWVDIR